MNGATLGAFVRSFDDDIARRSGKSGDKLTWDLAMGPPMDPAAGDPRQYLFTFHCPAGRLTFMPGTVTPHANKFD